MPLWTISGRSVANNWPTPKTKFLHTNVLRDYAENKPLATWVNTQRKQYKLFKTSSKKSDMTSERIQSLDDLGFEWEVFVTWEERRQELADFKMQFLRTNVPRDYAENKPLATWVDTQRKQ